MLSNLGINNAAITGEIAFISKSCLSYFPNNDYAPQS